MLGFCYDCEKELKEEEEACNRCGDDMCFECYNENGGLCEDCNDLDESDSDDEECETVNIIF